MKLCLIALPDEVLIYIFSFLDIVSLVKVSLVCKKLKSIASSNAVWLPHNLKVLNKALLSGIPVKEQCRISHRWRKGLGYSLKLQSYPRSFMPWMDISQRKLYTSQGDMVQKFELRSELNSSNRLKRLGKSAIKFEKTYVPQRGDDVYQFCVRRNLLVCGGWNGYLSWTDLNSDSTNINKNSHESDIHAVDFRDNIIVSGSRKEDIKVWRFNADYSHISECTSINTMDRILSLRINPTLSTFVSGTGGILAHPLRVWDLNRGEFVHQLGKNHRLGGGPLDMAFTGAHTLLSAGYDTYIKLWDTRKSTSSGGSRTCLFCYAMSDKAKMHQAAPRGNMPIRSYARAARATENTKQLERPNCLSIKGKIRLDRPKTLEIIKKLKFQKKIFGIAEMQGGIIDITCTSREAVLKLHEILEKQEEVQSVRLYQTDKIGIALGWVPIPMENGVIQEAMKEFGCVHKIIRKTDKDGMVTGMRIVIMNKQDIKDNPIPSYLIIQGYEVYVTYTGQEKTCRFCSETGHVRLDCPHWRDEFPVMGEARKKSAQSGPTSREVTPRDVTTPTHLASSSSLAAESLLPKYDKDILEANGNKKTTATSGNKRPLSSPEEVSHSKIKSISLSDNKISVWCKTCNKEGLVAEESTKYLCWGCKNEFNVIKTCCTQDEFFLVSSTDKSAVCPACREGMRLMPCCTTYQPTMQIADGTLQCPNCERRRSHDSVRFLSPRRGKVVGCQDEQVFADVLFWRATCQQPCLFGTIDKNSFVRGVGERTFRNRVYLTQTDTNTHILLPSWYCPLACDSVISHSGGVS